MFHEFARLVERLFGETLEPRIYTEAVRTEEEPDEVITGKDRMTYLLNAPGYTQEDFLVSVLDDAVQVKTPDFLRRRGFGTRVDPASAKTTYRNGVLSVEIRRAGE